jgi:hypothetical protein
MEYNPSSHFVQLLEFKEEIYPDGQSIHLSWVIEYVPSGHWEHNDEPSEEYSPSLHGIHIVLFSLE